jgi:large subunit ribosomal protein L9
MEDMKIILLEDIRSLGKKGDAKEVSEGYARNFLIPKRMAEVATPEAMQKISEMKKKEKEQQEAERAKNRDLAEKISKMKISISAKEKKGKLFGSVTPKQIVEELEKQGLNISQGCVMIKETIKRTGEFEVGIKLSEEIFAKLKLEVKGT